jgi:hypothetical protein
MRNPHWACVVGYGPFFLWVIHKEGVCACSRNINRLMMTMRNTADVIGDKPVAVRLQYITGGNSVNSLVAFYDIHGKKRKSAFLLNIMML